MERKKELPENKTNHLSTVVLFAAAVIWGSSFFIMKDTVDSFPFNYLITIRFGTAALLLSLIFHKRLKQIDRTTVLRGLLAGFTLFISYWFQTAGLLETTPGKNAFLTAVYCVMIPFLNWLFFKSRPDRYNVIAAFLCITGIGFVSLSGDLSISRGDGLTLICGFCFAINMILISYYSKKTDLIVLSILQFAFAALFGLITAMTTEVFPSEISIRTAVSIVYLAVVVTAIAFTFQNYGIKHEDASRASIILSLESVFGVFFSVIFYHEKLTVQILIGFIIIFIAVITSETKWSFLRQQK